MPRPGAHSPQLQVPWSGWRDELGSSLSALIRGPSAPKDFPGKPFFRDCSVRQPFPKLAFLAAIACHVLFILFPPSIWKLRAAQPMVPEPRMELVWYGPARDFPAILPMNSRVLPAPSPTAGKKESSEESRRGADGFHPRQTIISEPLHPTHPRQTLVQPSAPPEPPKILPPLPNMVELRGSQPAKPKLQLTAEQLSAMRPTAREEPAVRHLNDPRITTPEQRAGAINIASFLQAPPKPALPVSPMAAPHAAQQQGDARSLPMEDAPRVGTAANTLIALSASPAAGPAPPAIPAGNLAARISISPEGTQPGAPGVPVTGKSDAGGSGGSDAAHGAGSGNGQGGGLKGPEGIFISGGSNPGSTTGNVPAGSGTGPGTGSVGGPGAGAISRALRNALPANPTPRVSSAAPEAKSGPSVSAMVKEGAQPETVLGAKRVYTLHVNMPNLTSASGSWILNFAEMDEFAADVLSRLQPAELTAPVPLRKVDPKYPPELRTGHVEGEVILYAVIRKDGTVDSIQLVRGIDPHLDVNAMDALAQWKFRPAEKHGAAIDLEAVVHIPFRSRVPGY